MTLYLFICLVSPSVLTLLEANINNTIEVNVVPEVRSSIKVNVVTLKLIKRLKDFIKITLKIQPLSGALLPIFARMTK